MPVEKDKWYTRPIFSVGDVEKSLSYYCEMLGFAQSWKYEEDDQVLVAQVSRGDFELILAGNLNRKGKGRVFISLTNLETDKLRKTIESKDIPYEEMYWGYPSLKLRDPDGNEMIFPQESEG